MLARGEEIPLPDSSADVVLSNGAFNLSPDKALVLAEIHRVLRPRGRLMMADMFLKEGVSQETVATLDAWSDWISGALPGRDFLDLLKKVGFVGEELVAKTGYKTSEWTMGWTLRAHRRD